MASLVKAKGLYYLQFYSKNRIPQRKQVPLNVRTKDAACRLKIELEDRYALGRFDPWESAEWHRTESTPQREQITLEDACQRFLVSRSHLSPYTVETYDNILRNFRKRFPRTQVVTLITGQQIGEWLSSTKTGDVSRKTYLRHLNAFFRWLLNNEFISAMPTDAVRLKKVPHKFPKYLTQEQVAHLVRTIHNHQSKKHVPESSFDWLIAIIRANACLGLRAGEICSLRWSAVDLPNRRLVVLNTEDFTSKGGRERMLPLSESTCELLHDLRSRTDVSDVHDFVFKTGPNAGKLNRRHLSRQFKRFARDAGLGEHCFHSLRHTAASILAASGTVSLESIRIYLGHSSVQVTQKYMHVAPDLYHGQITDVLSSFSV